MMTSYVPQSRQVSSTSSFGGRTSSASVAMCPNTTAIRGVDEGGLLSLSLSLRPDPATRQRDPRKDEQITRPIPLSRLRCSEEDVVEGKTVRYIGQLYSANGDVCDETNEKRTAEVTSVASPKPPPSLHVCASIGAFPLREAEPTECHSPGVRRRRPDLSLHREHRLASPPPASGVQDASTFAPICARIRAVVSQETTRVIVCEWIEGDRPTATDASVEENVDMEVEGVDMIDARRDALQSRTTL